VFLLYIWSFLHLQTTLNSCNQNFQSIFWKQILCVLRLFENSCLWFRASLIYINNCPTRCNTKQPIYYSASSLHMFRVSKTPIIRSTLNSNYSLRYCTVISLQRGQAWPRWREVAAQKMWPVPEFVVTLLCTPDDGCGWHPKHVEWTCRIINRLLCVASRRTIINILSEKLFSHFMPPVKRNCKILMLLFRVLWTHDMKCRHSLANFSKMCFVSSQALYIC